MGSGALGVFLLDDKGFKEFPVDIEEHDPAFVALCFDDDGRLWVTSRTGEVYRFDGVLWMRVGNARDLGLACVARLIPDGSGAWVFGQSGVSGNTAVWKAGRWPRCWGG